MSRKVGWFILVPVLLLAILGVVMGTRRSSDPVSGVRAPASTALVEQAPTLGMKLAATKLSASNEKAVIPPTQPGHYPEPGDPEYPDYQEMLRQPEYQLSVSNSPGFRIPYDSEWRSMRTGRRDVAMHDRPLSTGGSRSQR